MQSLEWEYPARISVKKMYIAIPDIKDQGDEVRGSNERFLLKSDFDAKKIHRVKQSALLIAVF